MHVHVGDSMTVLYTHCSGFIVIQLNYAVLKVTEQLLQQTDVIVNHS